MYQLCMPSLLISLTKINIFSIMTYIIFFHFFFFFAIFKVNRSSGLRSQGQFQQCHSFPMTTNFGFH